MTDPDYNRQRDRFPDFAADPEYGHPVVLPKLAAWLGFGAGLMIGFIVGVLV